MSRFAGRNTLDVLNDILNNPDQLNECSLEELNHLREQTLNPYTGVLPHEDAKDKFSVVSVTNWRYGYMRHLLITSLVGFLSQVLKEYEPDEFSIPPEIAAKLNANDRRKLRSAALIHTKKEIRHAFMRNFEYDANRHSVPANKKLPTLEQMIVAQKEKLATLKPHETKENALFHLVNLIDKGDYTDALEYGNKMISYLKAESDFDTLKTIPPEEVFYNWERYFENNFETIKEKTNLLYNELEDYDCAVCVHAANLTDEDADNFINKNRNNAKTGLLKVQSGTWTIMSPYEENRDVIDVFNKDTNMFKEKLEHDREAQEMGSNMLNRNIYNAKKKNLDNYGEDDPGMKEYLDLQDSVNELGKRALTDAEREKLSAANRKKRNLEKEINLENDELLREYINLNDELRMCKAKLTKFDKIKDNPEVKTLDDYISNVDEFKANIDKLTDEVFSLKTKLVEREDYKRIGEYLEIEDAAYELSSRQLTNLEMDELERMKTKMADIKDQLEVPDGAVMTNVYGVNKEGKFAKRTIYTAADTPKEVKHQTKMMANRKREGPAISVDQLREMQKRAALIDESFSN